MGAVGKRLIVVGVEWADSARRAALWAAEEAVRRRAVVRLVHAVNVSALTFAGGYTPPADFFASIEETSRHQPELLRELIHGRHPELEVELANPHGHPATVLLDESREACFVVLGAPEQNAVYGAVVGATSVTVAAHAKCPTAIIREDSSAPTAGPVVVGVDGSPTSEAALALAFEEASLRHAELVAVHGWSDFVSDREYRGACRLVIDWNGVENQERETLAERLAGWQEKYPEVVVHRVVGRQRAAALLLTQARRAQLLVVGTRGRGGFTGLLLGSVSQKLIHHAGCPLVVTPAG